MLRLLKATVVIVVLTVIAVGGLVALRPGIAETALTWLGLRTTSLGLPPLGRLPRATLAQRLQQIGPAATQRLRERFAQAGVSYPPAKVTLVAIKAKRELALYASPEHPLQSSSAAAGASADTPTARLVHRYWVLAASGGAGPKLREGDRQVPEGVYRIEFLNPNSLYHVSLRLDYPNVFDRAMAAREGRTGLGGDIIIHGRNASIGCLAMGDPASEELFVLAATVGLANVTVIVAPVDLRTSPRPASSSAPPWIDELDRQIEQALAPLPP